MKTISVKIKDGTQTELTEEVLVNHLSDLSAEVRDVMDDFIEHNDGALMPPITIEAKEQKKARDGRTESAK